MLGLARGLIPTGLVELAPPHHLPALGDTEFTLRNAGRTLRPPALQLADAIMAQGEALRGR